MKWSYLELKVPPAAVVAIVALLMKLSERILPEIPLPRPVEVAAGVTLAAVGLLISTLGAAAFRRSRTTLNPLHPEEASTLVTDGIFRYSRNPIYLGMLSLLLAWSCYLSHPASILIVPLFVLYMNRFQITPEEHSLRNAFGEAFREYAQRVGRWL